MPQYVALAVSTLRAQKHNRLRLCFGLCSPRARLAFFGPGSPTKRRRGHQRFLQRRPAPEKASTDREAKNNTRTISVVIYFLC